MLVPVMSAGSKSEVNWMREKSAAIEEEEVALASVVLFTLGMFVRST
jgi:hypothetical protein